MPVERRLRSDSIDQPALACARAVRASTPRSRRCWAAASSAVSRPRCGVGQRRQQHEQRAAAPAIASSTRGRRSDRQRQRGAISANTNESPYTPVNGARRSGTPMSMPALPSASQAKPSEPCVHLDRHPQRRRPPERPTSARIRMPASSANTRQVQRLGQAEQQEAAPSRRPRPGRRGPPARTESSSRRRTSRRCPRSSPAGSGAAGAVSRADGHQQRRQRDRRQPRRGRTRERSGSAAPPRASASSQFSTRPSRFVAHHVGHVGTAHQRSAEHHLEAEREAVIAPRFELPRLDVGGHAAGCGASAAGTARWWRRRCPLRADRAAARALRRRSRPARP